ITSWASPVTGRPRGSRGRPSPPRRTHRSRRHRASRATSPLHLRAGADVEGDDPVVVGDDEESGDERADDEADADPEVDEGPAAGPTGRGRHGSSSRAWAWPAEMSWKSRLVCHSRAAAQAAAQAAAHAESPAASLAAHPA